MKSKLVVMFALLVATSAFAEESIASKTTTQGELGMDQKLARVYELYRKGDTVSLKQDEMQVGLGVAYTTSNKETLGVKQSARNLTMQVFASRGVSDKIEVSVAMPYIAQSQHVETPDTVLANSTISGVGDPTIRFIDALPTKEINTTAIFSATLPTGKDIFSRNETHTSLGTSWGKVLRPAFVSGGLTWERDWKSKVNSLGYNAGLGFFLNHALSVGGEIAGVVALNPKIGTTRDSATLGIKVAYQTTPDFGVIALVNIGVATDTPQATMGITTYWRF